MVQSSVQASSTIFWVFGMIRPGIEPRPPGALANTLTINTYEDKQIGLCKDSHIPKSMLLLFFVPDLKIVYYNNY